MRNKIDVYTHIGGAVYTRCEISTAPLSTEEQQDNHLVVLTSDEVEMLMERNGSFFVYNMHRNRFVRENANNFFSTLRPYHVGFLIAILKDMEDAYTAAAEYVVEHTDPRAGMKVWVRLSKRVAFGYVCTLKALGIGAAVTEEQGVHEDDALFTNWRRVSVPRLVCIRQLLRFSFDPLSSLRQSLAISKRGLSDAEVFPGHDVRVYRGTGSDYTTVGTFDGLMCEG